MKIAQNTIDDLQVLAHHAEISKSNLEFNHNQIRQIRQVILDLMMKIVDLEKPTKTITDEEIQQVLNDFDWSVKFVNPFDFAKAILEKAQEK
jgi:hypothetical protein